MQSQRLRIPIAAVVIGLVGLTVTVATAQFGRPPKLPDSVELEADIP